LDLALPAPSKVVALIRFETEGAQVRWINASTILLEGSLPPSNTYFHATNTLAAEFDGQMVVNLIWAKIYHVGDLEPPYKIWLTITGNLQNEYGAGPFSVEGTIRIIVHHSPPPP
jgi:hypothetical protein